jgi:hypothetical protein
MTAHITFRDGHIETFEGVQELEDGASHDEYEVYIRFLYAYGKRRDTVVLSKSGLYKIELLPE